MCDYRYCELSPIGRNDMSSAVRRRMRVVTDFRDVVMTLLFSTVREKGFGL